jgi:hypothetical protein
LDQCMPEQICRMRRQTLAEQQPDCMRRFDSDSMSANSAASCFGGSIRCIFVRCRIASLIRGRCFTALPNGSCCILTDVARVIRGGYLSGLAQDGCLLGLQAAIEANRGTRAAGGGASVYSQFAPQRPHFLPFRVGGLS